MSSHFAPGAIILKKLAKRLLDVITKSPPYTFTPVALKLTLGMIRVSTKLNGVRLVE